MDKRFAILRVEKMSNNSTLKKKYEHNVRISDADNITYGIDNIQVIGDRNTSYAELVKDRLEGLEYYKSHTLRSNAVKGYEVLLNASPDVMENLDVNKWTEKNIEWLKKYFGDDNVLSATLHLDELQPHIHAFVTPVVDGRFCSRNILNSKQSYRDMQDSYADAMDSLGLKRGFKYSKGKHNAMWKMYRDFDRDTRELPPVNPNESAAEYRDRFQTSYHQLNTYCTELERDSESYFQTAQAQGKIIERLESENKEIKNILASLKEENLALNFTINNFPGDDVRKKYKKVIDDCIKWGKEHMSQPEEPNHDLDR